MSYPAARQYVRRSRRPGTNVLVVAPHPDDDTIGCGGTLARLATAGARIGVTYVTDGSASHLKSKRFPPDVLRGIRENEARAALGRLGIFAAPQFLRAPDSGLSRLDARERDRLIDALAARLAALRVNVLFSPWPRDPHPDHVATAGFVHEALARSGRRVTQYFYRVWLPVRGNAAEHPQAIEVSVCDVRLRAEEVARKRSAVMEHRSQTGALIDDDPDGFCIDAGMLEAWLAPLERFFRPNSTERGRIAQ